MGLLQQVLSEFKQFGGMKKLQIHTAITGTYCKNCEYKEKFDSNWLVLQVCENVAHFVAIQKKSNSNNPLWATIDTLNGPRIIVTDNNYCDFGWAKKSN